MKSSWGWRGLVRVVLAGGVGVVTTACATTFTGDAHVPGGAAGCESVCAAQGMSLAGMVVMGEYSDGCICKVRSAAASGSANEEVAGAAPAAVGVVMAMRARQSQQQAAMH